MPISFVAAGAVATGTNPVVAVPAGYQIRDLLVLTVAVGDAVAPNTPSGWTLRGSQTTTPRIYIYTKFSNQTESSVTVTVASTTTAAVMVAYRGVSNTDTISAFATATSTTVATNTLTTSFANEYVVSVYAMTTGADTWTAPGSTNTRVDSAGTASAAGILIVDELQAAAGTSLARTATSSASKALAAGSFSIIPSGRYWVGGAGTWNNTNTTNWSFSSGGSGGAPVPTAQDDVFFNASSGGGTFTVQVSASGVTINAKSIDATGFTNTFNWVGFGTINLYGNLTLDAGNLIQLAGTGPTWNFRANATIDTKGKQTQGSWVVLDNAVLNMASTTNGAIFALVSSGTFNTNNYAMMFTNFTTADSAAAIVNFGSSLIMLNGTTNTFGAASVMDFGTSTLEIASSSAGINATNKTIYNIVTSNSLTANVTMNLTNCIVNDITVLSTNSSGGFTINGPVTINGTVSCTTSQPTTPFTFNNSTTINNFIVRNTCVIRDNVTITGSISTTTTSIQTRAFLRSNTTGSQAKLIVNGTTSLADIDFTDIAVSGTAAPISGTRLGNRGGNSGITFVSKTVYWNLAGSQNWSAVGWADTPTGTPDANNYPLPQDTAAFTNSGAVGTVTLNNNGLNYVPTIDMSARTSPMTLSFGTAYSVFGNWINGSGTTLSGAQTLTFLGRKAQSITSAGKTFPGSITIDSWGGTVTLSDALNIGANTITVTNGTFNTAGFAVIAGDLVSTTTTVRGITLGASTVTLSGSINITNEQALLFSAGTSQINLTANLTANLTPFGMSFNNLSFPITSAVTRTITGANTFSNLSFTTNAFGQSLLSLTANQTVTGTFTCSGSAGSSRAWVLSNTLGTQRTITAATLVSIDCDFRDIVIAGGASGSSPTRAGNYGNNSGINFPAPKNVYWNLAGTQNWNANAWAATSGASPSTDNFPLPQDTAIFDNAGAVGTVNLNYLIGNIDCSARTLAMTLSHASATTLYGNYFLGSGVTTTGAGLMTMVGFGASEIRCSGNTLSFPVQVSKNIPSQNIRYQSYGSVTLGDAFATSGSITLATGVFSAGIYNVSCVSINVGTTSSYIAGTYTPFSSFNYGSGVWTLSGSGTVIDITSYEPNSPPPRPLAYQIGTAKFLLTNNTTAARSVLYTSRPGSTVPDIEFTGNANYTLTFGNNRAAYYKISSTHTGVMSFVTTTMQETTYGTIEISGSPGNVKNVNTGIWRLFGTAPSGIDYLNVSGINADAGAEWFVGANSTVTSCSNVFAQALPASRTLYWVGGTGNWNDSSKWSLSSGGPGGETPPRSMDDVVFNSASNATAYTVTVNVTARFRDLTISGPASGNVTLAGTATMMCFGSFTLPATGLTRTFTGGIIFYGDPSGRTITTNGVTLASNIDIFLNRNGSIGLGSALNIGTASLSVISGTFNTNNYNITAGAFAVQAGVYNWSGFIKTINLGSSTITLSNTIPMLFGVVQNDQYIISLNFNAGTSQINFTNSAANINSFGGVTFYNVSYTGTGAGTRQIAGTGKVFNALTLNTAATGLSDFVFGDSQTIGSLTCTGSSATQRCFVRSATLGFAQSLDVTSFSGTDVDFRDITVTGVAAPISGTRLGNAGGNSGITFSSKTVFWNLAGTQNFDAVGWATTSTGTPAVNNFPLPQDTATFTNDGAAETVNFGATAYNFPSIDASTRTSAMTLGINGSQNLYGSFILGSGITLTGTSAQTFLGATTQTITSAGKTIPFAITIGAAGRTTTSVALGDTFVSSSSITLTSGTFNANNQNLTVTVFSSNNSNIRTVTMGSGTWTLSGTGTVWDFTTSTNATVNRNTAIIVLSNTSTTARTFAGGGLTYPTLTIGGATGISTLTISGNNAFAAVTSTKTVAHTIAFGATTQLIESWTVTGTSGNIVTITLTGNLIYTGTGNLSSVDYLNAQGRAYGPAGQVSGVWYIGANSINSVAPGWVFTDPPPPPPPPVGGFFLLF